MTTLTRVLCVDDERNVLDGLRRSLHGSFDVTIAEGPHAGLAALAELGPFEVVTSDLRMPEMDGIQFLSRARETSPDTTRILLTGNADVSAAIGAVNQGSVFRFLTKPCPRDVLTGAIEQGAAQFRLVTSERVLLEKTLHGVVTTFTEALALVDPQNFGRARQLAQRAGAVSTKLGGPAAWKMELAAMLAQVALVTLPDDTLKGLSRGTDLDPEEREMVANLPAVSARLLAHVPRIDEVLEIVQQQGAPFGIGAAVPADKSVGASILRACLDVELCTSATLPPAAALAALRAKAATYEVRVLDALAEIEESQGTAEIREVYMRDLRSGMVLLDPVRGPDGRLLVAAGVAVSLSLAERLQNFARNANVKEPVRVAVIGETAPPG